MCVWKALAAAIAAREQRSRILCVTCVCVRTASARAPSPVWTEIKIVYARINTRYMCTETHRTQMNFQKIRYDTIRRFSTAPRDWGYGYWCQNEFFSFLIVNHTRYTATCVRLPSDVIQRGEMYIFTDCDVSLTSNLNLSYIFNIFWFNQWWKLKTITQHYLLAQFVKNPTDNLRFKWSLITISFFLRSFLIGVNLGFWISEIETLKQLDMRVTLPKAVGGYKTKWKRN